MRIEIYSDGSATTKDKPGGWGYVMVIDGAKYSEGSGHMENASNNDAEMEAAIQGLAAALKYLNDWVTGEDGKPLGPIPSAEVTLVADSQLVLGWVDGTYRFKQQDKIPKYNQLKFLVNRLKVKTRWVRGHAGDEHNERCDKLANCARKKQEVTEKVKEKKITPKQITGNSLGKMCVWYQHQIKVIDLDRNIVQNYKEEEHGSLENLLKIDKEPS